MNNNLIEQKIEIWKKIIETQMHFNDLEMKVRNFGILLISAFIGGIGVSFRFHYQIDIMGLTFHPSALLSLLAIPIWIAFYFVDVYWYHPLLLGAVRQGIIAEKELKEILPSIALTHKIGSESPRKIIAPFSFLYRKELHSTQKAHCFYLIILAVLLTLFLSLAFFLSSGAKT
jgi:flagellar biosynthesis protein FliQ